MREDKMTRFPITAVIADKAPKAIGPYSQAVKAGQFLFLSGQIPLDPMTGKVVGSTVEEQTSQALKNVEAILEAEGLSLSNVVRAEVYLKDMNDFSAMNKVYAEKFSQSVKPARHAMQVAKLPLDALVEITCIAFIP